MRVCYTIYFSMCLKCFVVKAKKSRREFLMSKKVLIFLSLIRYVSE